MSATGNSGKCRKSLITDAEEDKDPLRENNLTNSFYFPSKSTPQNVTLMLIYEICRWLDSPSAAPYTSLLYLERVIVWKRNAWVKMTKTSQKYSKNALSLWGRGGGGSHDSRTPWWPRFSAIGGEREREIWMFVFHLRLWERISFSVNFGDFGDVLWYMNVYFISSMLHKQHTQSDI